MVWVVQTLLWLKYIIVIKVLFLYFDLCLSQGSTHLQKSGRLDFSLKDHEGEVKAWQGDFQQRHRDMFSQKYVFFSHFFFFFNICIWSVFANILLISFIFNNKFMFCICFIIIIDHIFVDIRFYSLGQVGSGEQFVTTERPSSVVCPSVNFSHCNQLLWSHWANLNQTLVE